MLYTILLSLVATQWAKSPKNSLKVCVFVILHSKYSVKLSKIHSYRLLFCPLGIIPGEDASNFVQFLTMLRSVDSFQDEEGNTAI